LARQKYEFVNANAPACLFAMGRTFLARTNCHVLRARARGLSCVHKLTAHREAFFCQPLAPGPPVHHLANSRKWSHVRVNENILSIFSADSHPGEGQFRRWNQTAILLQTVQQGAN
jgi:hypothetical protein